MTFVDGVLLGRVGDRGLGVGWGVGMEVIGVPGLGVVLDISTDALVCDRVTNDDFVVVALPEGDAGGVANLVDFFGGYGFEGTD